MNVAALSYVGAYNSFYGNIGILRFLNAVISYLCQPSLEGFGFWGRDRLNNAEYCFHICTVCCVPLSIFTR